MYCVLYYLLVAKHHCKLHCGFFSGFKSQVEKGKDTGHESEETKPTELARDDEDAKGKFSLDSTRL